MPQLNFVNNNEPGTIIAPVTTIGSTPKSTGPQLMAIVPVATSTTYPTGSGYLEYGSGVPGSLPFRVDQNGNVTATSFSGLAVNSVDWFNVQAYGADPAGITDSTTAFQNALNAIAAAGGGVLYIPVGQYLITSTLTYTSTAELHIRGDVPNGEETSVLGSGTMLYCSPSSYPFSALSVTNSHWVTVEDIAVISAQTATVAQTYNGFSITGAYQSNFSRVHCGNIQGKQGVNIGIYLNNCNNVDIDVYRGYCNVNGIYLDGTSADVNIRASDIVCQPGTGSANGGCIVMGNTTGTLHINNVTTGHGDWGLITLSGANVNEPGFIFINDFEVNNSAVGGVLLQSGGEVWMEQAWISDQGIAPGTAIRHGILCETNFEGVLYLNQCAIQDWSGHGIWMQTGNGFSITDSVFGGSGLYATNTYDDIHVAAAISNVTISGNHFEVDRAYTPGGNVPRSGVYIESGVTNYHVDNNIFATNYGTASCVDMNVPAQRMGFNNNVNGFEYKDAGSVISTAAISTVETILLQLPITPQDIRPGAMFKFKLIGTYTNGVASQTNTLTFRAGTTGTTADTSVAAITMASASGVTGGTAVEIEGLFGISAIGSAGTGRTEARLLATAASYAATTVAFTAANVVAFNTNTSLWLSLTFVSGNAANTFAVVVGEIDKVA